MSHLTEVLNHSPKAIQHLIAAKSMWDNSDMFYLSFMYNIHSNSLVIINDGLTAPFLKTDNYSDSIDMHTLYEQIDVSQKDVQNTLEVAWCVIYDEMMELPVGILDKSVAYHICKDNITLQQYAELVSWGDYQDFQPSKIVHGGNNNHWYFDRSFYALKPRYTIYESVDCYNNLLGAIKTFQGLKNKPNVFDNLEYQ